MDAGSVSRRKFLIAAGTLPFLGKVGVPKTSQRHRITYSHEAAGDMTWRLKYRVCGGGNQSGKTERAVWEFVRPAMK
jgi:hypothetical protein